MVAQRRVGDWIDNRFEVFDIHTGGMGVVYVVYDHRWELGHRLLALKTLRDEYLGNSRQTARFVEECRTWIRLESHPFLVRAYSVQLIEGKPYVLMELVRGGNLRKWIGKPRLDVPQTLRFLIQLCLAMEHAASKGMHCHRDIKPENLLITDEGVLKVTDFGLARIGDPLDPRAPGGGMPIPLSAAGPFPKIVTPVSELGRGRADAAPPEIEPARQADTIDWPHQGDAPVHDGDAPPGEVGKESQGVLMGTGAYMSPEQYLNPTSVTVRGDIYSTGIVLHEMIAGHVPFRASRLIKLARLHAKQAPPSLLPALAGKVPPAVARDLDRIARTCLAKDAADRFATFAELRAALEPLLETLTGEVIVPPTEAAPLVSDFNSKGVSLGNLGHHQEELEAYEAVLRGQPDHALAWSNKAAALGCVGRFEEAAEHADMALNLAPANVGALVNKGLALFGLRRYAESLECLDKALHLEPRAAEAWTARAVVLLGLGNVEGAKAAFEQVKRIRHAADPLIDLLNNGIRELESPALPWMRRVGETAEWMS